MYVLLGRAVTEYRWGGSRNILFIRHKSLVLTVKIFLQSVYIYGSYRKIKTGVPFFGPPCIYLGSKDHIWGATADATMHIVKWKLIKWCLLDCGENKLAQLAQAPMAILELANIVVLSCAIMRPVHWEAALSIVLCPSVRPFVCPSCLQGHAAKECKVITFELCANILSVRPMCIMAPIQRRILVCAHRVIEAPHCFHCCPQVFFTVSGPRISYFNHAWYLLISPDLEYWLSLHTHIT